MTIIELLAEKIKNELLIEVDPNTFTRTYASRNMKAMGAFIWTFTIISSDGLNTIVGSTYSATECVRKDRYLTMNQDKFREIEIFPEERISNENKN